MFTKVKARLSSDGGDSEMISLIILLPILLGVLFTMIDSAVYFTNRSTIQSIARDGARSVAIMGGNGTNSMGTPIEVRYGLSRSGACSGLSSRASVKNAYSASSTPIECNLMKTIADSSGLINVTANSVTCTPQITSGISQQVSCKIVWGYGSIPGGALGYIKGDNGQSIVASNTNTGTAESEVNMTGISMVTRPN